MNKTVTTSLFSLQSLLIASAASLLYFAVSFFLIGFKTDQVVLAIFFNACYFLSSFTRKFIIGFSIFIVYWIIFDYMKALPNYTFNTVHIQDLYNAEKSIFGLNVAEKIITPNEYWIIHQASWLDLLTGIFYLCWIPVPLAFAGYLFLKNKLLFLHFSFTFVLVNFIGFIVYYIYPAAPPWYMQQYGDGFIPTTAGNTAGLSRFDQLTGSTIFQSLYAKSSNVFAAMPSLHSAYPLIVLYYGIKKKVGLLMTVIFTIVMVGIWFAAVYTSHHYILDVLAGIAAATLAIVIYQKWLLKTVTFNNFLQIFINKIE